MLAVPRPKQLKRIIPAVASLGVDRVVLTGAARVEKSYFDSRVLAAEFLDELVTLGLEQACDTVLDRIAEDGLSPDEVPAVFVRGSADWPICAAAISLQPELHRFIETTLPSWEGAGALRLVPHPYAEAPLTPVPATRHLTLAIGPDGGWVPAELALFERHGFTPVSLGRRVLRGEVAVPAIIGALRAAAREGAEQHREP